jgi:hypothetical protein
MAVHASHSDDPEALGGGGATPSSNVAQQQPRYDSLILLTAPSWSLPWIIPRFPQSLI